MTPKKKAAQIYDQYWGAVSRGPVCKTDELPDMRPLLEQAIIEAVEEERAACVQIAETIRVRELNRQPDGSFYDTIAEEIRDRIQMRPATSNQDWRELPAFELVKGRDVANPQKRRS